MRKAYKHILSVTNRDAVFDQALRWLGSTNLEDKHIVTIGVAPKTAATPVNRAEKTYRNPAVTLMNLMANSSSVLSLVIGTIGSF